MPTYYNQFFKSTDLNAPVLTGQVNSLPGVLNKCLVTGYTTASVTSLTESGVNYTAVLAVANTTLVVGDYILFAGASPGGANIAMRINTVTDSTHVICTGPGGLGAISGTITYCKAPLQWGQPFSAGTNSQSYRPADTSGNRFYLQVIDNGATAGGAKEAQIYGAEVLTADQTPNNGGGAGSGQFPTTVQSANGLSARKSTTADSTARAWTLFGDGKRFYMVMNTGDASPAHPHAFGFGDAFSVKSGDAYHTFIGGDVTFNSGTGANGLARFFGSCASAPATTGGLYFARSYSQTGSSVPANLVGWSTTGTVDVIGGSGGAAELTYPNPPDNGLYVNPLGMVDAASSLRARLPGIYAPMHNQPLILYETTAIVGLSGVTGICVPITSINAGGEWIVDAFGPWA